VAQHEQLVVFGRGCAATQGQPAEEMADDEVEQAKRHDHDRAGPWDNADRRRLGPQADFWNPARQGRPATRRRADLLLDRRATTRQSWSRLPSIDVYRSAAHRARGGVIGPTVGGRSHRCSGGVWPRGVRRSISTGRRSPKGAPGPARDGEAPCPAHSCPWTNQ
jgi:hypothetical protein